MTEASLDCPKDYAYYYRDRFGFSVFILKNPEHRIDGNLELEKTKGVQERKQPAVPVGHPWFELKPADEQIERWFEKTANWNLAIPMGPVSQAVAFDIDGPGAVAKIESLIPEMSSTLREAFNNTMKNRTGRGGEHIVFKIEGEINDVGKRQLWSDGKNHSQILLIAKRSYIVAAPSRHPNGRRYEWNGKELQTITRQDLDQLVRLISPAIAHQRAATEPGATQRVYVSPGEKGERTLNPEQMTQLFSWVQPYYNPGSRNDIIFYLSGMMRIEGFTLETARRFIKLLVNSSEYPDENLDKSLTVVDNTYRKPIDEINGKTGLHDLLVTSYESSDDYDKDEYLRRCEAFSQICQVVNCKPETRNPEEEADDNKKDDEAEGIPSDDGNGKGYDYKDRPGEWLRRQILADKNLDINDALVNEILRRDIYRTFIDTKEIVWYEDGVFHYGGWERINSVLEELGGSEVKNARRSEVIERIRIMTYTERVAFDKDPLIIIAKNGVVDLATGKRMPHNPYTYPSLVQIPHNYYTPSEMRERLKNRPKDRQMLCKKIVGEYLCNVLEPQDIILSIEFWGYDLMGSNWLQKALMCIGPPDAGKSTHVDITEAFLGKENCANKTLKELTINRFAKAGLYGKLANTCADISNSKLEDIETFKMLVTGDDISAEKKGKDAFNFTPRSKLHFSANTPPLPKHETDEAFYKRWILLLFAMKKGVVINRNLLQEIIEDENELDDLLYLAVQAAGKLLTQQGFSGGAKTYDIDIIMEAYMRKAKPIVAWADDNCVIGREYEGEKDRTFDDFKKYCRKNRLPYSNSKVSFAQELTEVYHVENAQRGRRKEKRRNVWKGISLIEDLRPEQQTEIFGDDKDE